MRRAASPVAVARPARCSCRSPPAAATATAAARTATHAHRAGRGLADRTFTELAEVRGGAPRGRRSGSSSALAPTLAAAGGRGRARPTCWPPPTRPPCSRRGRRVADDAAGLRHQHDGARRPAGQPRRDRGLADLDSRRVTYVACVDDRARAARSPPRCSRTTTSPPSRPASRSTSRRCWPRSTAARPTPGWSTPPTRSPPATTCETFDGPATPSDELTTYPIATLTQSERRRAGPGVGRPGARPTGPAGARRRRLRHAVSRASSRAAPRPAAAGPARARRRSPRAPARRAAGRAGGSRTPWRQLPEPAAAPGRPRRAVARARLDRHGPGLPAARPAAGLAAGPGRLPRPGAAARAGRRCRWCCRRWSPASRCVTAFGRTGAGRGAAARRDRRHHPLHDPARRPGAHVRLDAVLRAQRRGRAARRRRASTTPWPRPSAPAGGRRSAG